MDSDTKSYHIYALMLPGTLDVHVHRTTEASPRRLYEQACKGKVPGTTQMAEHVANIGTTLALYHLEDFRAKSGADAYHRCIAWQRLFMDQGYTLQSVTDIEHVQAMTPLEQEYYGGIQTHSIERLCTKSLDLAPSIIAARRGPRSTPSPHSVRVPMTDELYRALEIRARRHGMRPSQYLLSCAMDTPVGPDLTIIVAYHRDVSRVLTLLRGYATLATLHATHPPDDVRLLTAASARISENLQALTACLTSLATLKPK